MMTIKALRVASINPVDAPQEVRIEAGSRLACDCDLVKPAPTTQAALAEVPAVARRMFEGKVHGRTVVDVNA